MRRRFSSSSLTGILRCEVAVGTARLASMFSTILSAGPRIGIDSEGILGPPATAGGSDFGVFADLVTVAALAGAAVDNAADCGAEGAASPFEPTSSSK